MKGQMSIFDWMPTMRQEPAVGEYVHKHGAVICHIMRKGYIGHKVCFDVSTQNHRMYQVGILEKYIPHEGYMRSVIYTGKKQRSLITHYPWDPADLFECLPWDAYPERMAAIGKH